MHIHKELKDEGKHHVEKWDLRFFGVGARRWHLWQQLLSQSNKSAISYYHFFAHLYITTCSWQKERATNWGIVCTTPELTFFIPTVTIDINQHLEITNVRCWWYLTPKIYFMYSFLPLPSSGCRLEEMTSKTSFISHKTKTFEIETNVPLLSDCPNSRVTFGWMCERFKFRPSWFAQIVIFRNFENLFSIYET